MVFWFFIICTYKSVRTFACPQRSSLQERRTGCTTCPAAAAAFTFAWLMP